jgi:hypothetical protein
MEKKTIILYLIIVILLTCNVFQFLDNDSK